MNLGGVSKLELNLILVLTSSQIFLIEDFDVNFLSEELVSALFIKEDPNTYKEATISTVWKEALKLNYIP